MANSHLAASSSNVQTVSRTWDSVTAHASAKFLVDTNGEPINARITRKAFTLTTYTSAAQVGDVICATQLLNGVAMGTDIPFVVYAAQLQDKDDQIFGCEVIFFNSNVTFGTAGSSPSITDANGDAELQSIDFTQAAFKDRGDYKINKVSGLYLPMACVSGTDDVYVAVRLTEVPSTDPTFTASGLILTLWVA